MKRSVRLFALLLSATLATPVLAQRAPVPVAAKKPHFSVNHGDTLRDDYFWLREKTSPDVIKYLEAENAFADAVMEPTRPLQETLYKEMLGRVQETDTAVPYLENGWYYYSRTEAGKQYSIHCRKKGSLEAKEEVILDVNALAEGKEFISVADLSVSDDGNLLAFGTDESGFRQYRLHVKDLRTGAMLKDTAERVTTISWASDNKTLFYTQEDPVSKRWHQVYRHELGSDAHTLVYEEKNELFDTWAWRSRRGSCVFIGASSSTTSELWFIPADKPTAAPRAIAGRVEGREYYAEDAGDRFLIRTNDKGRNFRVVSAPVSAPEAKNWKEIHAHNDKVMIEDVDAFESFYVLWEREDGLTQLRFVDARTGKAHRATFPEPVYVVDASDNAEYKTTDYRFVYESFVTPSSVFDYTVATRERKLLKQKPVLGGYNAAQYRSERLYATASDGTRIPISVVYRAQGAERPANRPLYLVGYGSYGISMDVSFNSDRFSLIDRGMVYAIAHIRGGGEMGKGWHEDGRLMEKKNTFTDYIACAEYLVKEGWTSPDRLVAFGRSAGGLLMGAVANMRPDLFKIIFTQVPFVDVMNTMLDSSLPLTTGEYLEWGNPNEKPAYDYMKSYSPYDNLEKKAYPIMLVRTSLNDSQVMYWEPAKWVAKLRTLKTDDNLLVFRTKMEPGGHSGASGRYDKLRDVAWEYAFILTQLGIGTPQP